MPLIFEPLGPHHNRGAFSCGVQSLDDYLQRRASQDIERNVAACWVLCERGDVTIAGYYTLSSGSVEPTSLPPPLARRLPRYRNLPVILIGRLARDSQFRGQGIGEILLYDALHRAARAHGQIASWAIVVDAEAEAVQFYRDHEFQPFQDRPESLYLPMSKVLEIFPQSMDLPSSRPPR